MQKGAIVVVAAGNSSMNAADFAPASCNNVITVAASGPDGNLAFYSNSGNIVKILAPGGSDSSFKDATKQILSLGRSNTYAFAQGTSMASPHVAGVIGLTISRYPNLTNEQIVEKVLQATMPLRNGQCPQPCGRGLLNADIP